jgi:DNA-binding beta-propeller fold protein YncE
MSKTLLDYAINPTPYPIQASPSTGDPNLASLSLVVSNHSGDIITCSSISLSFTPGTNAEDFCSDPTGISSSPQTGWSVQQEDGLFTFTPDTQEKGQVGGDGLVFGLSGIKVNQKPGPFQITLDEKASDSDSSPPTRSRSWELAKFPAQFTVGDLNANPPIVESGGSTTLSWSGSGSSGNYTALYEIQYVDADGNKVKIDHPKGEQNQPLPPVGGYTVDGLKKDPTTFYLLVTVQIQGSNNPLVFTRETTVTVTAPHPPKPEVTCYTGELRSDGSLLLKWTTSGTKVVLKPALSSEFFQSSGHFVVQKPPLPLLNNDLYALTAMNDQGEKSDPCAFTTCKKIGVLRPAISVGPRPWAIAVSPNSSRVFVTSLDNFNVSILEVDLDRDPPLRVLPTAVGTGRRPQGIAVSSDGKYVFVANTLDNSVSVFGGTPPFQSLSATVPAGYEAECLAVSPPDGRYIFLFNHDAGLVNQPIGNLSVIDTAQAPLFTVVQGPTLNTDHPDYPHVEGMAASPDGRYVFVCDYGGESLWVLKVEAGANPPYRVLSSVPVGAPPRGVAVSPDGDYVFVANCDKHGVSSVSVIEKSSGPSFQVLSPALGAGPNSRRLTVSPDGRFLFVTSDNGISVWVIDKSSHPPVQLSQTLSVGSQPGGQPRAIAASPNGYFIFVANVDDSTISVIEPVEVSM